MVRKFCCTVQFNTLYRAPGRKWPGRCFAGTGYPPNCEDREGLDTKKRCKLSLASFPLLRRGRDSPITSIPLQTPLLHYIVGHIFTIDHRCSHSNLGYFWDIFTFAERIIRRIDLKLTGGIL